MLTEQTAKQTETFVKDQVVEKTTQKEETTKTETQRLNLNRHKLL